MQDIHFTGWDIGGAHLKVAHVNANGELLYVNQFATPLWQGLDCLQQAFPQALAALPAEPGRHVITMTAELVDIFPDRQAGVDSLNRVCREQLGKHVEIYASHRGFLREATDRLPLSDIASANWHASAELVANCINSGVFLDIGSTTTDVVPVADKQVLNLGQDDQTRLQHDELVYSGVVRTSLMALANRVPFAGQWQGIAAEHFATTADIYRILGQLDETADLMATADGGAKDVASSIRRLARIVGTDADAFPDQAVWQQLADFFAEAQMQQLTHAVQRVQSRLPDLDRLFVGAGAGRFLVKALADKLSCQYLDFSELIHCRQELARDCNTCAPAVALAQLRRLRYAA